MRVAVDLVPLAYTLTGIGVYLQQLIVAIQKLDNEIKLGFTTPCEIPSPWIIRRLLSRNLEEAQVKRLYIQMKFGCSPFGPLKRFCSGDLDLSGFDLHHITSTEVPFRSYSKPTVVSVYDLADLRTDRNSQRYRSLIPAIKCAEKCICISEVTRRDVLEFAGVPESRTVVTPLAPRPMFVLPTNEDQRYGCRMNNNKGVPYFVAVSTIEPRKNYVRMLQAFARIRERGHQISFLIAGAKRNAWPDVSRTIIKYRLQDCVRVLGWVNNARLLDLMWGSEGLAYASLYEGFGLPVVEAMATGTPVIASNTGSIPEVVGDTFPLVDPESVESIANRMEQVLVDIEAGKVDRSALVNRAQQFRWDRTAEQTIDVYRSVINR